MHRPYRLLITALLLLLPRSSLATDLYFNVASASVPVTNGCTAPTYTLFDFPNVGCVSDATNEKRFYLIGGWYPSGVSNHTGNWGWQILFTQAAGATNARTCFEVRGFVDEHAADVNSASSLDPCLAGRLGATGSILTDPTIGFSSTQLYAEGDAGGPIKNSTGGACDAGCLNRPMRLCVVRMPTTGCANNNANQARIYGVRLTGP